LLFGFLYLNKTATKDDEPLEKCICIYYIFCLSAKPVNILQT